ncbi:hypothetical protein PoB_002212600 [Plakobranchus ocellatus]|uniref:Fibronectin type-III domain-containing protein n=1 Tax=Plakobranchus ocellatus TaxID=259542 RepID=A0AAV3ZM72_9GAST|nr:hypothetical protein PoB_002212600 [Plakobranchus ocellatus]
MELVVSLILAVAFAYAVQGARISAQPLNQPMDPENQCKDALKICLDKFTNDITGSIGASRSSICRNLEEYISCSLSIPCSLSEAEKQKIRDLSSSLMRTTGIDCDDQSSSGTETQMETLEDLEASIVAECKSNVDDCREAFDRQFMASGRTFAVRKCSAVNAYASCVMASPCKMTPQKKRELLERANAIMSHLGVDCKLDYPVERDIPMTPSTALDEVSSPEDCNTITKSCLSRFQRDMASTYGDHERICSTLNAYVSCVMASPCQMTLQKKTEILERANGMIRQIGLNCKINYFEERDIPMTPSAALVKDSLPQDCTTSTESCQNRLQRDLVAGGGDPEQTCRSVKNFASCMLATPCFQTQQQKQVFIDTFKSSFRFPIPDCTVDFEEKEEDEDDMTKSSPMPQKDSPVKAPQVKNLQAATVGSNIRVTWEYSKTRTEKLVAFKIIYKWRSKTVPPGEATLDVKPSGSDSYTYQALLQNLKTRAKYHITVRPIYLSHVGKSTKPVAVWLSGQNLTPESELSVKATSLGQDAVLVTFATEGSGELSNLRIMYMQRGGNKWNPVSTENIQGTSALVTDLQSGETYFFQAKGRLGKKYKTVITYITLPGQAAASDLDVTANITDGEKIMAEWKHTQPNNLRGYKATLYKHVGDFHGPVKRQYLFKTENSTSFVMEEKTAAYSVKVEPFDDNGLLRGKYSPGVYLEGEF